MFPAAFSPEASGTILETGPYTGQCGSHLKRRMTSEWATRGGNSASGLSNRQGVRAPEIRSHYECLVALQVPLSSWCFWRENLDLRETAGKKRDFEIIAASGTVSFIFMLN